MRLHTLILSARALVPFMGIEIDPKIGAFCRTTGCPVLPHPAGQPNFDILKEFTTLQKQGQYAKWPAEAYLVFSSLADENIRIVLSHLK